MLIFVEGEILSNPVKNHYKTNPYMASPLGFESWPQRREVSTFTLSNETDHYFLLDGLLIKSYGHHRHVLPSGKKQEMSAGLITHWAPREIFSHVAALVSF